MAKTFGEAIRAKRVALLKSTASAAAGAGVSATYLGQLERGTAKAPPRATALRITVALEMAQEEARQCLHLAATERGSNLADEELPGDVRALIVELRRHGADPPQRLVRGIRTTIKDALG